MRIIIFLATLLAHACVSAQLSQELKTRILQLTNEVVTEKKDDFDKDTTVTYSGPEVLLGEGCSAGALVTWEDGGLQKPTFHFYVVRVHEDWRWLKFNRTQMLADGEAVNLEPHRLTTEVLGGGQVMEIQHIELPLDQVLLVVAADEAKMRIGVDEWTLSAEHRYPLQVVLYRWLAKGGDVAAYRALVNAILRPQVGRTYAEVVKAHGEPSQRDTETGWALWEGFWARFKNGAVVETRRHKSKD